ncbi:TonB-dependent receptor domain-containing protein [Chryseobacterium sp.]|uniref:TonB-dependent receptor domain-containing protein n=1 Tax=Chryseobacterium sp. TaxID=1871047 RepID=UPI002FC8ABE6
MKVKYFLFTTLGLAPFYNLLGQTTEKKVTDLKKTEPILKISPIDNTKRETSIAILKDTIPSKKDTLSNIPLTKDVYQLDDIVVTKKKTEIEQLLDKKVINVGQDILSSGGNALTVLERVPEIRADSEGNISLRGDKNVSVLVNGKPSTLSISELLNQIPASNINKIEIITSPSAKYTASGLTGIINIITYKKTIPGFAANTSWTISSLGKYTGDVDISLGREKVKYSLGIGYIRNAMKSVAMERREKLYPILSEDEIRMRGDNYNFKGGIDWFINKNNEFSLGFNYKDNNMKVSRDGFIFQEGETISQNNKLLRDFKNFDFTGNYRHVFNNPENFLEVDMYLATSKSVMKNEFLSDIGIPNQLINNSVTVSRISTDYTAKISEKAKLESGILWEQQKLDNNLSSYTLKEFQNTQTTYASYGLLKFDINKFNFQVGLRGELYQMDANLITENNVINNQFINLFPSLHVGYNIDKGKSISLGYNRRTTRPTFRQINPNVNQYSKLEIFMGSPDLRPEFSNNFDVNFQLKKSKFTVTTGLSYILRENMILSKSYINADGTTVYKPFNGGNSNVFGINASSDITIFKWWNSKLAMDLNYGKSLQNDVFFFRKFQLNYSITLQNDFKISKNIDFDLSWKYNGAEKSYLSDENSSQSFDIAVRHKVLKNNGNITLRFTDIFNTMRYKGQDYGANFVNFYHYKPLSQVIYLSFTYNIKNGQKLNERNIKTQNHKSAVAD